MILQHEFFDCFDCRYFCVVITINHFKKVKRLNISVST